MPSVRRHQVDQKIKPQVATWGLMLLAIKEISELTDKCRLTAANTTLNRRRSADRLT